MWEETTIEQTPQHKTTKDVFSFSNMISKFSPFSPSTERNDKNNNNNNNNNNTNTNGNWLTNKKNNKVPGSIIQTTSNRPSSPSPIHNSKKGKIAASEYFGNGLISTSNNNTSTNNIQDENIQNNTSPNTSPINKSFNNNNNNSDKDGEIVKKDNRTLKFEEFLKAPFIEMDKFTKLTWNGISNKLRPIIWRILIGYTPVNKERRETTLERKRKEYTEFLDQYWYIKENERSEYELSLFKQISIDVPRTNPTIKLFQQDSVQISLNKILYIWAIRHPASGYVQGINDLATPFFVVFISSYVDKWEDCVFANLSSSDILDIEADTFWCLSKLLDNVQDNYTIAQPGIHRMVHKMSDLVKTIDNPLFEHLEKENAQFIQFTFRWMNCLLMRELPLHLIVRMWDTYLSEGDRFANFHIYVCVAFLIHWSEQLRQLDFQQIMLFIQNIPTSHWDERQIEMLLSQAYMYQSLYERYKKNK